MSIEFCTFSGGNNPEILQVNNDNTPVWNVGGISVISGQYGFSPIMLVFVITEGGYTSHDSVFFDGTGSPLGDEVYFTQIGSTQSIGTLLFSAWFLLRADMPSTGAGVAEAGVNLSGSGNRSFAGAWMMLKNVAQQTPEASNFWTGVTTSAVEKTNDIAVLSDGAMLLDIYGNGAGTSSQAYAAKSGQTEMFDIDSNSLPTTATDISFSGSYELISALGTITNGFTPTNGHTSSVHCQVSISPYKHKAPQLQNYF